MRRELAILGVLGLTLAAASGPADATSPPTLRFTVIQAACPVNSTERVSAGCADTASHTIYVQAGDDAFALEHEIGHEVDAQQLTPVQREHLTRLLGYPPGTPWFIAGDGFRSPGERFADGYAACRLDLDPERRWETAYDYQPTRRQLARVCAAISRYTR